jgi:hypothetical protein
MLSSDSIDFQVAAYFDLQDEPLGLRLSIPLVI